MAYDYQEDWQSASLSEKLGTSGNQSQSSTRRISIVADTNEEGNDEKAAFAGLPQIGDPHPRLGDGHVLTNTVITRVSPVMWNAQLTYTTVDVQAVGMGGTATFEAVPWAYPTKIIFGTSSTNEDADYALAKYDEAGYEELPRVAGTSYSVKTVTGQRYTIPTVVSDLEITLKRAFLTFKPSQFYKFIDCVNQFEFLGFPPGVLKINSISATPSTFQNISYYNIDVTILARKPTDRMPYSELVWWWNGMEEGNLYRKGDQANDPVEAKPVKNSTSIPLNNNGTALQPGETPQTVYWQRYPTVNFDLMGFDVNWQP